MPSPPSSPSSVPKSRRFAVVPSARTSNASTLVLFVTYSVRPSGLSMMPFERMSWSATVLTTPAGLT